MNKGILEMITNGEGVHPQEALEGFHGMIRTATKKCAKYDLEHTDKYDYLFDSDQEEDPAKVVMKKTKVEITGKNAAGFDIPLFKNFFKRNSTDIKGVLNPVLNRIHYKVLDVGSMYYTDFGYVPGLDDINKITGRTEVSHRALEDALDVVYAIRHKMGML